MQSALAVLGAAGGIGPALARGLAAAGHHVVAAGRDVGRPAALAAAKAGLPGLVLSAAATSAARGLRVNALGRLRRPAEVASALAWFLSPEQGRVTGQVLGVDEGPATVRARAGR